MNVWEDALTHIRSDIDTEDFRRWFAPTSYASDAGLQITVWVPTEAIRQHLMTHFQSHIGRAFSRIGRTGTQVRFVVAGIGEDEDEE